MDEMYHTLSITLNGISPDIQLTQYMRETGTYLAEFLREYLPYHGHYWWVKCVKEKLKDDKIARVKPGELEKLDLAPLLTVFNKNFEFLAKVSGISRELWVIVKEMQCLRNKLAHLSQGETVSGFDLIRDYDTIYRFASGIGAPKVFLDKIHEGRIRAVYLLREDEVAATEAATLA